MKKLDKIKNFLLSNFDKKDGKSQTLFLKNILSNLEKIKVKLKNNKRIILYGDVQSGKTNNLILLSSYMLDNDVDWIIILTSERNLLNSQTYKRFEKAYKNLTESIRIYPENRLEAFYRNNNQKFLILKKQFKGLHEVVSRAKSQNKKIVIFDDECDHWSKNSIIRSGLNDFFNYKKSIYIGVSATPFWNFFSNDSKLNFKIDDVCVLNPGENYLGFHNFNNYKKINFNEFLSRDVLEENNIKISHKLANQILPVVAKWIVDEKSKNILINIDTKISTHSEIKKLVLLFISEYFEKNKPKTRVQNMQKLNINKQVFNNLIDSWYENKEPEILIINSKNKEKNLNTKSKKILIGGFSLSRGNTFSLTDMIIKKSKQTNFSVLMQNSRWLGYREVQPNVFMEEDLIEKFKEIKEINEKIKKICKKNGIKGIQEWCQNNLSKCNKLFDDVNKIDESNKILKKAEKILETKIFEKKENLIKKIKDSERQNYKDVVKIIDDYSLANKKSLKQPIFNEKDIDKNHYIWLLENNEKSLQEVYKKENEIFEEKLQIGEDILHLSKRRKGHSRIALKLKEIHKKCAICLIQKKEFLYASHIKRWSKSSKKEKVEINNFLVLCSQDDDLFEKNYLSFNKEGFLYCHPKLYDIKWCFPKIFNKDNLKKIKLPVSYYKKPINNCRVVYFLTNYRKIPL